MAKIENKDIIEAIKEKTILEVKELVDAMKEEFGVDPMAVAVAAAPAAAGAAAGGAAGVDLWRGAVPVCQSAQHQKGHQPQSADPVFGVPERYGALF